MQRFTRDGKRNNWNLITPKERILADRKQELAGQDGAQQKQNPEALSFDEVEAVRITVFAPVIGFDAGNDRENETAKANANHHGEQKKADAENGQRHRRNNSRHQRDENGELKIQRRFAVDLNGRDFVLLDLPYQERAKNVAERNEESGKRAQMTQHVPGVRLLAAGRLNWRNGWIFWHQVPFVRY
jgi:hypothetical protein